MTEPLRLSLDATAVPDFPTGAGRYVLELAQRLGGRPDVELILVCRRDDATRWREIGDALIVDRAPPARPLRLAWEHMELPRVLDQLDVDGHHSPHSSCFSPGPPGCRPRCPDPSSPPARRPRTASGPCSVRQPSCI